VAAVPASGAFAALLATLGSSGLAITTTVNTTAFVARGAALTEGPTSVPVTAVSSAFGAQPAQVTTAGQMATGASSGIMTASGAALLAQTALSPGLAATAGAALPAALTSGASPLPAAVAAAAFGALPATLQTASTIGQDTKGTLTRRGKARGKLVYR
jgi:hypothetical protein